MSQDTQQAADGPPLAARAGSAKCRWIISSNIGGRYCECAEPATMFDPEGGQTVCDDHARDYADAFGDERLRYIVAPEPVQEIPCPDCYGGHFRPCNICGDSGVALLRVESPNASPSATEAGR